MSITFVDDRPSESVAKARELAAQGIAEAWDALDRHLRWHLVNHIQNRSEDVDELEGALLEASHWAIRQEKEPWRTRWPYLLELLTDSAYQPSLAVGLKAVEGRAAEVLMLLIRSSQPLRPSDVSAALGISPQQVSNLGQKLETAGLIVRRRSSGRFTWMFPTMEGTRLAEMLPGFQNEGSLQASPPAQGKPAGGTSRVLDFWNQPRLDQDIPEAA